jgi:hypothetical protein
MMFKIFCKNKPVIFHGFILNNEVGVLKNYTSILIEFDMEHWP